MIIFIGAYNERPGSVAENLTRLLVRLLLHGPLHPLYKLNERLAHILRLVLRVGHHQTRLGHGFVGWGKGEGGENLLNSKNAHKQQHQLSWTSGAGWSKNDVLLAMSNTWFVLSFMSRTKYWNLRW